MCQLVVTSLGNVKQGFSMAETWWACEKTTALQVYLRPGPRVQ